MSLFFIYNFYFENLIYKLIKQFFFFFWVIKDDKTIWKSTREQSYFLDNVLVGVKVVFLPDCPLVLSLLKHKGVGAFFNKKNEDSK